ncbi:hypothetical protein OJAV_G00077170 [Oryzias javanicus]|uniref:Histone chaperone domain-containing protein n=1 Tax=Oryzias javanicus TaxID=123683 RepID=A0A3S2MY06_ORYJA|nr:hypothetical protein OJAV_G00077170 [Oryzias javanicus]
MSSESERAGIRKFVRHRLRDEPDLSKLTLGLLKRQYLVHVGHESLSPEAKALMKQVVEEELANMQDSDNDESDCEVEEPHIKRKRVKHEEESEEEKESRAKKRRSASSALLSESEDKTGSEDERQSKSSSEGEKHEVKKSGLKRNPESKEEPVSEDSVDEEMNESKSKSNEASVCSSPEQKLNGQKITAKAKNTDIKNANGGTKTSESDAESSSEKSDSSNGRVSAKNKGKVLENKRDNGSDSDSSSLPSLEDEKDHEKKTKQEKKKTKDEKKKTGKKDETSRSKKPDGEKAIIKLKRYISLCGVRKNYKKMLEGCKSIKAKVAVLKKELEDLGVQGNPSIEKCKKIRMKREEAQEVAELDVGNIISTQGRPKRRGISARQEYNELPSSAYQRTLNSSSGSDRENQTSRERKKISEWTNLRGIISDDGDSS